MDPKKWLTKINFLSLPLSPPPLSPLSPLPSLSPHLSPLSPLPPLSPPLSQGKVSLFLFLITQTT